eukprot:TRINITY_DN2088_c0_g1_i1.p1 TRINITY_DN2088_c0_g1~~TRINITY_DN2088_c0_g1_i1.p1  ORF type:complete len:787 (-),score=207.31 TRINITY_DN2088_c0_g1_i1:102-2462(-)
MERSRTAPVLTPPQAPKARPQAQLRKGLTASAIQELREHREQGDRGRQMTRDTSTDNMSVAGSASSSRMAASMVKRRSMEKAKQRHEEEKRVREEAQAAEEARKQAEKEQRSKRGIKARMEAEAAARQKIEAARAKHREDLEARVKADKDRRRKAAAEAQAAQQAAKKSDEVKQESVKAEKIAEIKKKADELSKAKQDAKAQLETLQKQIVESASIEAQPTLAESRSESRLQELEAIRMALEQQKQQAVPGTASSLSEQPPESARGFASQTSDGPTASDTIDALLSPPVQPPPPANPTSFQTVLISDLSRSGSGQLLPSGAQMPGTADIPAATDTSLEDSALSASIPGSAQLVLSSISPQESSGQLATANASASSFKVAELQASGMSVEDLLKDAEEAAELDRQESSAADAALGAVAAPAAEASTVSHAASAAYVAPVAAAADASDAAAPAVAPAAVVVEEVPAAREVVVVEEVVEEVVVEEQVVVLQEVEGQVTAVPAVEEVIVVEPVVVMEEVVAVEEVIVEVPASAPGETGATLDPPAQPALAAETVAQPQQTPRLCVDEMLSSWWQGFLPQDADSAVLMIQAALRTQVARHRLIEQLEQQERRRLRREQMYSTGAVQQEEAALPPSRGSEPVTEAGIPEDANLPAGYVAQAPPRGAPSAYLLPASSPALLAAGAKHEDLTSPETVTPGQAGLTSSPQSQSGGQLRRLFSGPVSAFEAPLRRLGNAPVPPLSVPARPVRRSGTSQPSSTPPASMDLGVLRAELTRVSDNIGSVSSKTKERISV